MEYRSCPSCDELNRQLRHRERQVDRALREIAYLETEHEHLNWMVLGFLTFGFVLGLVF